PASSYGAAWRADWRGDGHTRQCDGGDSGPCRCTECRLWHCERDRLRAAQGCLTDSAAMPCSWFGTCPPLYPPPSFGHLRSGCHRKGFSDTSTTARWISPLFLPNKRLIVERALPIMKTILTPQGEPDRGKPHDLRNAEP